MMDFFGFIAILSLSPLTTLPALTWSAALSSTAKGTPTFTTATWLTAPALMREAMVPASQR